MSTKIIALLTDFGLDDWFVGAMHAEILKRAPETKLIDITHAVPPQNIEAGAFALEATLPNLPRDTIICAVVDPGVGTTRRAVCGRIGQYFWSGPDNGLATPLLNRAVKDIKLHSIEREPWRRPHVSDTFHGRDVFAPAAAQLALGFDATYAGPLIQDPVYLDPDDPEQTETNEWRGRVVWIDRFGNCITNFETSKFQALFGDAEIQIKLGEIEIKGLVATYGNAPVNSPIAYWGSAERLEIGINHGSAAAQAPAALSEPVTVRILN